MKLSLHTFKILGISVVIGIAVCACNSKQKAGEDKSSSLVMSKDKLKDKIRGGWAGQTIGVVYGAPVEFKYQGSIIDNYQNIPWSEHYVKYWFDKKPGLFDDIYTDMNFVDVFEKYGLDVKSDSIANHWASAEYHLAHANQASRYNILRGIMPPQSGHWMNNPHADDLDFQIEADFIGMMAPGMVNAATEIADRVGHVMNSGDGWYGGVFVSALYSLAFTSDNTTHIVEQAIKTIPKGTKFHDCISDVIKWHKENPNDWQATWFELQKKWNKDVGCPKGVFLSFNIDAKINSAYVGIGLLYGKGDFTKSIDIATRCGQDADCNPATVGGVLGAMLGYSAIPEFWLKPLQEIEPLKFEGTESSLNKAYDLSFKHALGMIERNGGSTKGDTITIPVSEPIAVAFEQNFENTFPQSRDKMDSSFTNEYAFEFTGNGYILYGNMIKRSKIDPDYLNRIAKRLGTEVFGLAELQDTYVAEVEVYIDGKLDEKLMLPMKNTSRRTEPVWKYQLPEGKHQVRLKWLNHLPDYEIRINDMIVYSSKPSTTNLPH